MADAHPSSYLQSAAAAEVEVLAAGAVKESSLPDMPNASLTPRFFSQLCDMYSPRRPKFMNMEPHCEAPHVDWFPALLVANEDIQRNLSKFSRLGMSIGVLSLASVPMSFVLALWGNMTVFTIYLAAVFAIVTVCERVAFKHLLTCLDMCRAQHPHYAHMANEFRGYICRCVPKWVGFVSIFEFIDPYLSIADAGMSWFVITTEAKTYFADEWSFGFGPAHFVLYELGIPVWLTGSAFFAMCFQAINMHRHILASFTCAESWPGDDDGDAENETLSGGGQVPGSHPSVLPAWKRRHFYWLRTTHALDAANLSMLADMTHEIDDSELSYITSRGVQHSELADRAVQFKTRVAAAEIPSLYANVLMLALSYENSSPAQLLLQGVVVTLSACLILKALPAQILNLWVRRAERNASWYWPMLMISMLAMMVLVLSFVQAAGIWLCDSRVYSLRELQCSQALEHLRIPQDNTTN